MLDRNLHIALVKTRTVILVFVAIAAWCANPDEQSFKRSIARRMVRVGDELAATVAPDDVAKLILAARDWEHTSYGFFSVVRIHTEVSETHVGAFGGWFLLSNNTREHMHPRNQEMSWLPDAVKISRLGDGVRFVSQGTEAIAKTATFTPPKATNAFGSHSRNHRVPS